MLLTHGDSVAAVPDGFRIVSCSGEIVAGLECASRNFYGVQFHPEVDLSPDGVAMFKNFLFGICKLSGSYSMGCRQELAIKMIQETVGEKQVLVLVSGGVDSSVCAALLHRALGPERIIALHIDHGFMRHEESTGVVNALEQLGLPIHVLHGESEFAQVSHFVCSMGSWVSVGFRRVAFEDADATFLVHSFAPPEQREGVPSKPG